MVFIIFSSSSSPSRKISQRFNGLGLVSKNWKSKMSFEERAWRQERFWIFKIWSTEDFSFRAAVKEPWGRCFRVFGKSFFFHFPCCFLRRSFREGNSSAVRTFRLVCVVVYIVHRVPSHLTFRDQSRKGLSREKDQERDQEKVESQQSTNHIAVLTVHFLLHHHCGPSLVAHY